LSTLDEIRKLLQDFLAPELRTISARFDTLDERFKRLEEQMSANHREVMTALNIDKRLALLEDRQQRNNEREN
jgi:hypothetical protein